MSNKNADALMHTITLTSAEFIQMLNHFPQMIYWKDIRKGYFLGCNEKFAEFIGASIYSIVGQTGYDFLDPVIVELFRRYEADVIAKGTAVEIVENISHPKTGENVASAVMAPIKDANGEVTSIICYGTPRIQLSDKPWGAALLLINKKNMSKLLRNKKYIVKTEQEEVVLSRKEAECALYLLKGLRSKHIAREMGVAPRTIEYHIENIRSKLNCDVRTDLIAKLTSGNFLNNF